MNVLKLKKLAVAMTFLASGAGVAWASCGGTEGLVVASVGASAASLIAQIAAAAASLVTLDTAETQVLVSSIRAATKQLDASAEKTAATTIQSEQAAAAFAQELADKELANKVVVDYTSQGFNPCEVSDATRRLAQMDMQSRLALPNRYRTEVDAVGGRYADPSATVRAREELHRNLFCTQSEVDQGVCGSVGKIPGGDTNGALLFSTDTSDEARTAKNALINNLVGMPDAPIPPSVVNTPEAQAYLLTKKRKDVAMAWPAYSLKSIQNDNETVVPVLNDRVGMYFGTPKAAEWARSQTSQAPRGLMVDLVKIAGIDLKIAERRLMQSLRTEANLATMLEMENEARNGGTVEQAGRIASGESGRRAVK